MVSRLEAADIPAGKTVKLTGTVSGVGPFVYRWYKNNVLVSEKLLDATYVITNFQSKNAGSYYVKISNLVGSTTSPSVALNLQTAAATAIATQAPVITTQPVDKTVAAGSSVTFSVVATGSPTLTYQWLKNGSTIAGATASTYTMANVSASNAASYSVWVTNTAGSVRSSNASLVISSAVVAAPVITTQPVGKTVVAGSSVTFSVVATGSPAPTYQWLKNGVNITGATASTYTMANVSASNAASYSVQVTNTAGSVRSSNAALAVNPPLPPHADFDGDGKADILWQNILTGDHTLWLMSGTSVESGVMLPKKTTDWDVIGVSDFNGDRRNDILLQNLVTRESILWLMAGTTLASSVSLGVAPAGMLMVGTGDFNADGMPDVLWKTTSSGSYSIRFMNRTTPGASAVIGTGAAGWSVGGTGDFNGDGKTDILWQRASDGAARIWLMNGSAYVSATDLGAMGAGWIQGGTGDFNGDGKKDILWQNTVTGARKIALMSGLIKTSEVSLGEAPAEWIMVN